MNLVVKSPDELLAAVPHVLGFRPEESLVIVPSGGAGLPVARVDLPTTAEDRELVADLLLEAYGRRGGPGVAVGIVCFCGDRQAADQASAHLAQRLGPAAIDTEFRLWSNGEHWMEFTTGTVGLQTREAAEQIAVKTVLAGAVQPAASREALAGSLVGDRGPLQPLLEPAKQQSARQRDPEAERAWVIQRVERFHDDPTRLFDPEAARLLVGLQSIQTRDAVWESMTGENAASHVALWSDLTRRAPDEVRAAPAALLGFSAWLRGDGARAWCALDQVPDDQPYSMAALLATMLQQGIHPREWARYRATMLGSVAEHDESFNPPPPGHRDRRDLPATSRPADRRSPGR
ncbi:MAG: DUF4192 domain-containing protein [Nocardioidaceae bacterium]